MQLKRPVGEGHSFGGRICSRGFADPTTRCEQEQRGNCEAPNAQSGRNLRISHRVSPPKIESNAGTGLRHHAYKTKSPARFVAGDFDLLKARDYCAAGASAFGFLLRSSPVVWSTCFIDRRTL